MYTFINKGMTRAAIKTIISELTQVEELLTRHEGLEGTTLDFFLECLITAENVTSYLIGDINRHVIGKDK